MSLGQLVMHIATTPATLRLASIDTVPEPPQFVQPEATAAELVLALGRRKARRHLGGFDDAPMSAMWRLMINGREVMAMPRVAFVAPSC